MRGDERELTFRDVDGMSGEASTFPHDAAFLREKGGDFAAYEFVGDGLAAIGVQLVGVGHVPCSTCAPVVVSHGFGGRRVFGLVGVEGVSVLVFCAANFAWSTHGVYLEDGVVGAVDVGVDSETEHMLVVVGIYAGVNLCAPAVGILAGVHGVGLENTGEFDL